MNDPRPFESSKPTRRVTLGYVLRMTVAVALLLVMLGVLAFFWVLSNLDMAT